MTALSKAIPSFPGSRIKLATDQETLLAFEKGTLRGADPIAKWGCLWAFGNNAEALIS